MARVAEVGKPYPEALQASFERIMGPGVPPLALFTTIASSDRAWRKFTAGSLLDGDLLTLRQRELVIDRVCARCGCEYEWGVHVMAFAGPAGLSREEVAATLEYPLRTEAWSEQEASLLAMVDALHDRATLSEAEFTAVRCFLDERQIIEVLMLAGFYRTVAYIANGLDVSLERGAARFADYRP
jgi:alkylhydroperoxidase family enzyme